MEDTIAVLIYKPQFKIYKQNLLANQVAQKMQTKGIFFLYLNGFSCSLHYSTKFSNDVRMSLSSIFPVVCRLLVPALLECWQ